MIQNIDVFQLIYNFGFPAIVTFYLLIRFEERIDKVRESVDDLSEEVRKLK